MKKVMQICLLILLIFNCTSIRYSGIATLFDSFDYGSIAIICGKRNQELYDLVSTIEPRLDEEFDLITQEQLKLIYPKYPRTIVVNAVKIVNENEKIFDPSDIVYEVHKLYSDLEIDFYLVIWIEEFVRRGYGGNGVLNGVMQYSGSVNEIMICSLLFKKDSEIDPGYFYYVFQGACSFSRLIEESGIIYINEIISNMKD